MPNSGPVDLFAELERSDSEMVARWRLEAAATAPVKDTWAELVVALRSSGEIDRRGLADPALPKGLSAPEYALRVVLAFLSQQPYIVAHGADVPLLRLYAALVDIADGRSPPMLKPQSRGAGHPGLSQEDSFLQGTAARAMDLLIRAGNSQTKAAELVAGALGSDYKASTVKRWRDRLNERHGESPKSLAYQHYMAPLPPSDLSVMGMFLLRRLAELNGGKLIS